MLWVVFRGGGWGWGEVEDREDGVVAEPGDLRFRGEKRIWLLFWPFLAGAAVIVVVAGGVKRSVTKEGSGFGIFSLSLGLLLAPPS
jgi:hypothetical protein